MNYEDIPDWPVDIPKPSLPEGYEWLCLRPALGIGEWPNHPWWIRLSRRSKIGHQYVVRNMKEYYETPQIAIEAAMEVIKRDIERRSKNGRHGNIAQAPQKTIREKSQRQIETQSKDRKNWINMVQENESLNPQEQARAALKALNGLIVRVPVTGIAQVDAQVNDDLIKVRAALQAVAGEEKVDVEDGTQAILYALSFDDHHDLRQFLDDWAHGDYWPEYKRHLLKTASRGDV